MLYMSAERALTFVGSASSLVAPRRCLNTWIPLSFVAPAPLGKDLNHNSSHPVPTQPLLTPMELNPFNDFFVIVLALVSASVAFLAALNDFAPD